MRRWLAVLGLLFLAACQPAPGTTTASAPSSLSKMPDGSDVPSSWEELGTDGKQKSKYFPAEQKETNNRMVVALIADCYGKLGDKPALDRCLRQDLVAKFDDSGQGKEECAGQAELDPYVACILMGNIIIDFARRIDSEVDIEKSLWNGPRAFSDFIDKVVVSNAIAACNDEQTELAATRCTFDWLISRLALPEALVKKCSQDLAARERTICIAEAASIRFMNEHVSRAPGSST